MTFPLLLGMSRKGLIEESLTQSAIGAFYRVYNELGYGFLESNYVNALDLELRDRGHRVDREVGVQVYYRGVVIGRPRIDMIVDDSLIIETKSTAILAPSAKRQLYNYLRATNLKVGLLLHFGPEPRFYRQIADFSADVSVQSVSSVQSDPYENQAEDKSRAAQEVLVNSREAGRGIGSSGFTER